MSVNGAEWTHTPLTEPKIWMSSETQRTFFVGWGNGWYGRLAQGGDWDDKPYPVVLRGTSSGDPFLGPGTLVPGAAHIFILGDDGVLTTHGKCHFGQLGHGMLDEDKEVPTPLSLPTPPSAVYAGESSGFAVSNGGKGPVYAWGCGFFHGLGIENEDHALSPVRVDTEWDFVGDEHPPIVQIVGGGSHILIRREDGSLASGGGNQWGQTGHPGPGQEGGAESFIPKILPLPEGIRDMDAGRRNTLLLGVSGTVYVYGDPKTGVVDAPVLTPEDAFEGETILQVAMGPKHALAASDSAVFAWGVGAHGRLGLGSSDSVSSPTRVVFDPPFTGSIVRIAAGSSHSVMLTSTNEVWSWGSAVRGKQLFLSLAKEVNSRELDDPLANSPDSCVQAPVKLDLDAFEFDAVLDIAAGTNHTLLTVSGDVSVAIKAQESGKSALRAQIEGIQARLKAEDKARRAAWAANPPPPPPPLP